MPKEILELIKALEDYRSAEKATDIPDKFTLEEFITMMDEAVKEEAEPKTKAQATADKGESAKTTPKKGCCKKHDFNQQFTSYKVLSVDGTLTAVDLSGSLYVQVKSDRITVEWPTSSIQFTLLPNRGASTLSADEFYKLAKFVAQ